jgi:putative effector of murein hydrolase
VQSAVSIPLAGNLQLTHDLDDYVTRGVTLGGNSSAIATALLLVTDPRAAALSSLSMSLFGIITLALTSIPPIVNAVDSLVDL